MADEDNRDQLVKLALLGGAGFAAYKLVYQPWAFREEVRRRTEEEAARLAAGGMGIEEATQKALAGACVAAAALYKVPPSVSAATCQGVGVVVEKTLKVVGKGAVIAGKAIGSGIATGAQAVGSGVKTGVLAVGSGVKTGVLAVGSGVATGVKAVGSAAATTGKAVGTGAKFVAYTAPKAIVYDAPKAAVTTVAKGVVSLFGGGSSKKCRAKNNKDVFPNDLVECRDRYGITDCNECGMLFDLKTMTWPWQTVKIGAAAIGAKAPAAKPPIGKPMGMRGLAGLVAARRQLAGEVAPARKRQSLGGAPGGRRAGAARYLRHLK